MLPIQYQKFQDSKSTKNLCLVSVLLAFSIGLLLGIFIPLLYLTTTPKALNSSTTTPPIISEAIRTVFVNNSYSFRPNFTNSVEFIRSSTAPSDNLVKNGIYFGSSIEKVLPEGYHGSKHKQWSQFLTSSAVGVKMERGCGRMQNRLVTFSNGLQGCVRYRQNTDQIQGELFSFYLGQILRLPNLAPSSVSVVSLENKLWKNLRNEVATAQWNLNRAIVVTQFIPDLVNAHIPPVFRPSDRHLNKFDVLNLTLNDLGATSQDLVPLLVELAQWSDLIIFDYLTANLDRVVNNLYNFQWNVNIMDAPAHNLAKKINSNLLVFLDNESGLLHGYRLLKKYEIYHSLLLENLCLFRKQTADIIETLKKKRNIGLLLKEKFESQNNNVVKDVLPSLPDKSVKILNDRIDKVYNQIQKCKSMYNDLS